VIHKQGHAIGDMNHDNILVKDGYISLIDCDSYHITKGNQEFSGKTYFHRYHPPEKRGKGIDEVQLADRFGLAIHIFQLLMSGFHPYQSKGLEVNKHEGFENKIKYTRFTYDNPVPKRSEPAPQAPPYNELPANVQSLFNKCFVLGKRDPDMRPSAEEWVRTLRHTHSHQRTGIIRVSHVRQWINLPRKSMLPNWSKLPRLRLLRLRLIDVIGILLVFLTMYMLYTLGIVE
jgi:DNA-binding helix-hairpin-helix protein with protein kinase domain